VAILVELKTGDDLTEEHGSNTTTVMIKVVVATTPRSESPVGGAKVEVYVPRRRDFYRSLAYECIADKEGVVKFDIVSGRDYCPCTTEAPLWPRIRRRRIHLRATRRMKSLTQPSEYTLRASHDIVKCKRVLYSGRHSTIEIPT